MAKKKYSRPDPQEMSLLEAMRLRERKKKLTEDFRKGLVEYRMARPNGPSCDKCGKTHRSDRTEDAAGKTVNVQTVEAELYRLDDFHLCEECFTADWTYIDSDKRPGGGSPNPGIPRSQANYDGGRFNHGEW